MRLLIVLAACVGVASACASAPAPAADLFPNLQQAEIRIATASGTHRFSVWIAADEQSQQRGLMFVRQMPRDRGMLFIFNSPRDAAFWMKDTYLSLDLIFIDPAGTVLNIEPDARPHSLEPIESRGPVIGVLELLGRNGAGYRTRRRRPDHRSRVCKRHGAPSQESRMPIPAIAPPIDPRDRAPARLLVEVGARVTIFEDNRRVSGFLLPAGKRFSRL